MTSGSGNGDSAPTSERLTQLKGWMTQLENAQQQVLLRGAVEIEIGDKRIRYASPEAIRTAIQDLSWSIHAEEARLNGIDPLLGDMRDLEFVSQKYP